MVEPEIGQLLRQARSRAGLSQAELAARSGTSQSALASYESGKRLPGLDRLDSVLAALGLQLRLETEPLWERIDAAIAAAAELTLAERVEEVAHQGLDLVQLLAALSDVPLVVGGLAAAMLLGAPVPVRALDIVVPRTEQAVDALDDALGRCSPRRWDERMQDWGWGDYDPHRPGLWRWTTRYGELRATPVDVLPEPTTVLVGERAVPVVPFGMIAGAEAGTTRILERMRAISRAP